MKYIIRGDKLVVTDSIKNYIEEKLNKLNKYYVNTDNIECKVLIKSKNKMDTIEVTIPLNKFILRTEVSDKDLYAAIDLSIDKLEGQIRKNKTKLKNKYDKTVEELNFDFDADLNEDTEEDIIVKRKDIESKPMDEEEAVLQMKLLNHDFFAFKNIDLDCISVLYKRKDNKIGILNIK